MSPHFWAGEREQDAKTSSTEARCCSPSTRCTTRADIDKLPKWMPRK
jgi:hypothetical protein